MNFSEAIETLLANRDLSRPQMQNLMRRIMTGESTDSQISGFLIALRAKGETADEITAAAEIMRELSSKVSVSGDNLVDMVGTGGDSTGTFNISTASSFVISAAGAIVAKHGNRSVSSKSGSADLLEIAGVNLNLNAEQVANCIQQIGLGFMFAPMHHSAMKYVGTARKELAVRTVFNLLGPLTNPAGVKRQLTGVFAKQWVEPMAQVLKNLGSEQVMVVHSEDGMDEISICAPTFVAELNNGKITTSTITPEQFGFNRADIADLQVADSKESLALIKSVLNDEPSPARDIICLNAGAAIYTAGLTDDIQLGVKKAQQVISNGTAKQKLTQLITISQHL